MDREVLACDAQHLEGVVVLALPLPLGPFCDKKHLLRQWEQGWWWCDTCWVGVTTFGISNPESWREGILVTNTGYEGITPLPEGAIFPNGERVWVFHFGSNRVSVWAGEEDGGEDGSRIPFVFAHGTGYNGVGVNERIYIQDTESAAIVNTCVFGKADEAHTAALALAHRLVGEAQESKAA